MAIIIKTTDAPEWVRSSLQKHIGKIPRTISVEPTEEAAFGCVWHEACMRVLIVDCYGEKKTMESAFYDSILSATKQEQAMYFGGKVKIPEGCMILEILTYPAGGTLYVNPKDITPMLAESEAQKLTAREKVILIVIQARIPEARKEVWRYNKVRPEEFEALYNKGFLDKRHALTLKAKNALEEYRRKLEDKIFELRKEGKIPEVKWYGVFMNEFYAADAGLLEDI